MNFSTQKRNTGECKNYSERCLLFAGNLHMMNIATLFHRLYNVKFVTYKKVNIQFYNDMVIDHLFEELP
jgi:hypothetical protein